jgi:hypothetical protein
MYKTYNNKMGNSPSEAKILQCHKFWNIPSFVKGKLAGRQARPKISFRTKEPLTCIQPTAIMTRKRF